MIAYIIIGLFIALLHNLLSLNKEVDPEDRALGTVLSALFWPVVILVFIYRVLVGFFKALDKNHNEY